MKQRNKRLEIIQVMLDLLVSIFFGLIHRHCVFFSKPLHFEGWLFPCPRVKYSGFKKAQ
jgi:hypothetical protein